MDHCLATTIIGAAVGLITGKKLRSGVAFGVFSLFTLAPLTWWYSFSLRPGCGNAPARIYYEHGVTEDEIKRYQA